VTLTIDIDAADYLEAGEHQKRLESCLEPTMAAYPGAVITVVERRERRPTASREPRLAAVPSGKLKAYA
jgi:hypothetical protein